MLNTHLIIFFISSMLICTQLSFAQIDLHDNLAGVSVSAELDNNVLSINGNYEHELIEVGQSLIGFGMTIRHTNWSSDVSSNFFVAAQMNYNFTNIGNRKLVPLIGITLGSNIDFEEPYYSGHVGLRYFVEKDFSIVIKYGFGRRSYVFPEVGVDYKF